MLIRFSELNFKHGKPKGIIHIGAHLMEERVDYLLAGIHDIIWIEANDKICKQNIESYNLLKTEYQFNYAMSDVDNQEIEFKITNNGQSSSILELDKHKIHHPHIYVTDTIKLKTKRFDVLAKEQNIDIQKYNFINIDIQGAELLALKGFGDLLNHIDYIYSEVNEASLYKDCALITDMDSYLFEFTREETAMTSSEWGDAFYVRNRK
jgi:FkbM family methyltransferase